MDENSHHFLLRQQSTTSVLSFGAQTVMDPLTGSVVYPWNITVLQDVPTKKLTLQIRGIPYTAPGAGQTYNAIILVQDTSKADSTLTDAIRVTWEVQNVPNVFITVSDMYTTDANSIKSNFIVDTAKQDWSVSINPNEAYNCYKVNSQGCDVLTA